MSTSMSFGLGSDRNSHRTGRSSLGMTVVFYALAAMLFVATAVIAPATAGPGDRAGSTTVLTSLNRLRGAVTDALNIGDTLRDIFATVACPGDCR